VAYCLPVIHDVSRPSRPGRAHYHYVLKEALPSPVSASAKRGILIYVQRVSGKGVNPDNQPRTEFCGQSGPKACRLVWNLITTFSHTSLYQDYIFSSGLLWAFFFF
jgi:hypothetical protein